MKSPTLAKKTTAQPNGPTPEEIQRKIIAMSFRAGFRLADLVDNALAEREARKK